MQYTRILRMLQNRFTDSAILSLVFSITEILVCVFCVFASMLPNIRETMMHPVQRTHCASSCFLVLFKLERKSASISDDPHAGHSLSAAERRDVSALYTNIKTIRRNAQGLKKTQTVHQLKNFTPRHCIHLLVLPIRCWEDEKRSHSLDSLTSFWSMCQLACLACRCWKNYSFRSNRRDQPIRCVAPGVSQLQRG